MSNLKVASPDGYFDEARKPVDKFARFEEEVFAVNMETTAFNFKTFKKIIKKFCVDKKIIAVDLTSEYSKHLKKLAKKNAKTDIRHNLQKTISEYDVILKTLDDE